MQKVHHDTEQMKYKACEYCSFLNNIKEQNCRICLKPLTEKVPQVASKVKNFEYKLKAKQDKAEKDKAENTRIEIKSKKFLQSRQLNKFKKIVFKTTARMNLHKLLKEIRQPFTLIGLFVLGLATFLWLSILWSPEKNSDVAKNVEQANQEQTIKKTFPNRVFNYGGSPLFAALVSNGLNSAIEAQNPGTKLRFSQPLDDNHSTERGVERLIGKELSLAFSSRFLTNSEYESAQLRNIQLVEVPIGTDAIVFFGNTTDSVSGLNKNQIRDIYEGRIRNWNEINSQVPDIPIILVLSNEEEVEAFGIDPELIPDSAERVSNYTQAFRKVIGTPGAISFASASLVKGQEMIDFLDLAEGDSHDYVSPFIGGDSNQPNLEAFKNEKYPATRTIFVNYRDDNTSDKKMAISYINFLESTAGQEIIKASAIFPWGRNE